MTNDIFAPIGFTHGRAWKNRIALAPLTNQQSHEDGTLSDEEYRWLTLRAEGDFGFVPTCAAHVMPAGKAFPGQLGIFDDMQLPGLSRLAEGLHAGGAVCAVQLHHGGMRTLVDPVAPSDDEKTGARALTLDEVKEARDAFVGAAVRAERAGFDGVEIHGAHGYLLSEFLSPRYNRRTDDYGGSIENRLRLLQEIVTGIRQSCNVTFQLGLRLSPERYGQVLADAILFARHFLERGEIDYLDLSLWDVDKLPEEEAFQEKPLIAWFMDLPRGDVRVGVAGMVADGAVAARCLSAGADFVFVGKAGIVSHDLPRRLAVDSGYRPPAAPVSRAHLAGEGLSPPFIDYMAERFPGFVAD